MTCPVHVLVWYRGRPEAVRLAYRAVNTALAGTSGLRGSALLRSPDVDDAWLLVSEWDSLDRFQEWERTSRHRDSTAALRPFVDPDRTPPFAVYEAVDRADFDALRPG